MTAKLSPSHAHTATYTNNTQKDLRLNGKTLKRRQSINRDTGAFNNLIFQAQLGPPRLVVPHAIDKEALTGFCGWKRQLQNVKDSANSIQRTTRVSPLIL